MVNIVEKKKEAPGTIMPKYPEHLQSLETPARSNMTSRIVCMIKMSMIKVAAR